MPRKMEEVKTDFLNLGETKVSPDSEEVVKVIEGTLAEKGSIPFQNNIVGRYKLQKEDGVMVTLLGSTKMDDLLETIPTGVFIRLEYIGEIPTKGGFKMKDYKLSVEKV